MHYFIRVNGDTLHNNPSLPNSYIPHEPPRYPETFFSYINYCLRHHVIRIGWPDTGDLSAPPKTGALATFYTLRDLKPHEQDYLTTFAAIQSGSTVLMPDKLEPGVLYIGTVDKPYSYFHRVPEHPYECAHRLGIAWDRTRDGVPVRYYARELGIGIKGGFWTRAFQVLDDIPSGRAAIPAIEQARTRGSIQ